MPLAALSLIALRALTVVAALTVAAAPLRAECSGANLIDALPAADLAVLNASAEAQPHARGNFWHATRGTASVYLIGTYHLEDPRHAATLAALTPLITSAARVLVEAGPEEELALQQRIVRDPAIMFRTEGPTLPEQLAGAEWQQVMAAARLRAIPPFIAAKLHPWFLAITLAIPTCSVEQAQSANGLDAQIIDIAKANGTPVAALEPYDTIFGIFDTLPEQDQLSMLRAMLATEPIAEDLAVTTADAYFRQDTRLIWEFTRMISADMPGYTAAELDAEFARMESALMTTRNRNWIPVITAAAAKGPVVAAFGALHLSGHGGVLALLEREGFTLERLSF